LAALPLPNIRLAEVLVSAGAGKAGALAPHATGRSLMNRLIIGLVAAFVMTTAAYAADPAKTMQTAAGEILVAPNGMTLYTYDKDTAGATKSACTGGCIANWPPFVADADAKAEGDWTLVDVTDKDGKAEKMWAYDGKPLYFFKNDAKSGDTKGDGVGGVWHVVKAS
jgi:predicted lipoprotein with Yx(FWY)xxD motif